MSQRLQINQGNQKQKGGAISTLPLSSILRLPDTEKLWLESALQLCIFGLFNDLTSAMSLPLPFLFQSPEVSDLADFANGQLRHTLQVRNANIRVFVKLPHDDFLLLVHLFTLPFLRKIKNPS